MEKVPSQMTVIAISKPGGPEVLLPETRAVPAPGAGEILIKVMAAGVNRPDVAEPRYSPVTLVRLKTFFTKALAYQPSFSELS